MEPLTRRARPAATSLAAALAMALAVLASPHRLAGRTALPAGWPAVVDVYERGLDEAGIVGSALALVREGTVVATARHGYQDLASRRPVDEDTIFHWASITKTLTGIAIMQLRDRGRLSLDDPVVSHVPEIRRIHNPFGDPAQVTIRHLMSHSAGFRAGTWPWGGDQPWHPFEPTQWAQFVAMLPYTELAFAPGTRYSYSNPGVVFLGRILELISGDDYETYVTKNILMPLGMHRSFFDRAPYHLIERRSRSYFRTDEGLREARFDFDTGITVSNSGLNAPMSDMASYLIFLAGDAPRGSDAASVLARASLEEMFMPVLPAADGEGGSGPDVRIGLSFFVERHQGRELIAHSGNQNGFLSHFYLHRPSRTAYVVAFNTDASSDRPARRDITREFDARLRDTIVAEVFTR